MRHHILRRHGVSIKSTIGKNLIVMTKSQPFVTATFPEGITPQESATHQESATLQEGATHQGATVQEGATHQESATLQGATLQEGETHQESANLQGATLQERATVQSEIIGQEEKLASGSRVDKICYPNLTPSHSFLEKQIQYPSFESYSPENSPPALEATMFYTPEMSVENLLHLLQEAESTIPSQTEILTNFLNWMESMDGGCNVNDISKKAKMQEIKLDDMKDPDKVCKYFTSKQMRKEITAGSTDVYLSFYSSFMLYLHQNFKSICPVESYNNVEQRIHRYVNLLTTRS